MNNIIRRFFGTESNAGAGMTDRPARKPEQEAVKKKTGFPGTAAEAAGTKPQPPDAELSEGQKADSQHQSQEQVDE